MTRASLRSSAIRLAYGNPELRPHLLPLLRKEAAVTSFVASDIEKLRKEFLMLMKNVDRVKSFDDLQKLRDGVRTWVDYYEEVVQGLLSSLDETIWEVLSGEIRYIDYLADEKENWRKYWDKKIREGYWPLRISLKEIPYEHPRAWVEKWERGNTETEAKTAILGAWEREKKPWSEKAKRAARKAWEALDEYVSWVTTRREGVVPRREEKEIYRQDVEGFSVTFLGERGDGSGAEKLILGLKHYRERASKVFPLLLGPAKLPIQLRYDQGIDCGGRYERSFIVVCPILGPPKEYAHIIAHEMGHHVYQAYLSSGARQFWDGAIRQDHTQADLDDILAAWKEGEDSSDVVGRLAKVDSILALQIDGLAWANQWTRRDHVLQYRNEYGPKVAVPAHPITGYSTKNPEEAFCEAVGRLVAYGPRAVHPQIIDWLQTILPREVRVATLRSGSEPSAP